MVALGEPPARRGRRGDGASNAHEVYDPAADRWSDAPPLPTGARPSHGGGLPGRLWAIGGRTSFMGTQYTTVEIYDPATDAWSTGLPLPVGRGGLAAAALGDRLYVFGGEAPLRIFSANEMYEVAGQRWIGKDPMRTPRHGIGAAVVGNRIYVPGGATQPGLGATERQRGVHAVIRRGLVPAGARRRPQHAGRPRAFPRRGRRGRRRSRRWPMPATSTIAVAAP